jgi:hypothetical protein
MNKLRSTQLLESGRSEKGAVSIIVSVFISLLMVSLLALLLDSGLLFQERVDIQSSADSAVSAIVVECAVKGSGTITLNGNKTTLASDICNSDLNNSTVQFNNPIHVFTSLYANNNATDGKMGISGVCGSPLNLRNDSYETSCLTTNSEKYADCKPIPTSTVYQNFIRVRTNTLTLDSQNPNSIKTIFGAQRNEVGQPNILTDESVPNINAATLNGCAQAAWGAANSALAMVPIALPICFKNSPYPLDDNPLTSADETKRIIYQQLSFFKDTNCYFYDEIKKDSTGAATWYPFCTPESDPLNCPTTNFLGVVPTGLVLLATSLTNGTNFLCPNVAVRAAISVGDIISTVSSLDANTGMESLCPGGGGGEIYRQELAKYIGKTIYFPVYDYNKNVSNKRNCLTLGGSVVNCSTSIVKIVGFQAGILLNAKFRGNIFSTTTNVPSCPGFFAIEVGADATDVNCDRNDGYWPTIRSSAAGGSTSAQEGCDTTRVCLYIKFSRGIIPGSDIADENNPTFGARAIKIFP